ncbi:molybdopterin-dependent oxidoreductase [Nocardia arthritidis]|nr:molybdopterin-dependent oxidoreductase [Nocardia arthritidis]
MRNGKLGSVADAAVGLAALGVGEAVAAVGGDSLIDTVGRALIDAAPTPVVEATVALSGRHDKEVTRIGVGAGAVAAAVGLAVLPERIRLLGAAVFGAGAAALATRRATRSGAAFTGAIAAAGVLGFGMRGRSRARGGSAESFGGSAGSLLVESLGGSAELLGGVADSRRRWPRTMLYAAAGVGLLAIAQRAQRARDRKQEQLIRAVGPMGALGVVPEDGLEDEPGLPALYTANERFYVADVNLRPPRLDPNRWRLAVTGLVAHPLRLSLNELALDAVEFDAVMVCVHNRPGQGRVGNARWFGVPLTELLAHALPDDNATRLVTKAVDGYTISLPLEPLRTGEWPGYLVIGMNGAPLPPEHGFPARVIVPGSYGQYAGAKWLTGLEITDDSQVDYWWRRGWPRGPLWISPQARIDVAAPGRIAAGTTTMAGVAWAPPNGVARVELRVGEGDWQTTDLGAELAPAAWRRWRITLPLPPGEHVVQARAIGNDGQVQEGVARPPFPNGPAGYHTLTVRV